ncbi:MAG: EF-hand domain-containing protein [Syntrophales bacterium]|nr:EF-hand domain-containing protein [Syntrophales bacterium]
MYLMKTLMMSACSLMVFLSIAHGGETDKNREGKWKWEELLKPATEVFSLYDKNKNGYLEKEEFEAIPDAKSDFNRLDKNGDGKISLEELKEAAKERFNLCDRNKDGFVDINELKSCPPPDTTIKIRAKEGGTTYRLRLYDESFIPLFHIFF